MKYKIQSGLILKDILGMHVMVASGEALMKCPLMKQFNDAGAFYWSLLEQGFDEETILDISAEHFKEDREVIQPAFHRFVKELEKNAYIICFTE